ncbi:MAG: 6-phosphofructokinase [Clostridia bacterium]|nr:6-phosphofructokinase [Clostridia bacterium]
MKTIAVLTSGGDAPGMNAALRAVVRTAISNGLEVIGVKRGYQGLISGDVIELNLRSVSDIIHKGGTILYTARSSEFKTDIGIAKAVQTCKDLEIDGVVVIGGDGSFRGASKLSNAGVPCIGIPGTIDNDIACSEYTIGFDTATNTAMKMADQIRDTAQSHDKCSIVEVMGRKCGDIALLTGIAAGATVILVPEIEFDIKKDVVERIKMSQGKGRKHFIVVIAEGVGQSQEIANIIRYETGLDTMITILGHVQRGGSPTLTDRVYAGEMGNLAVKLLLEGKSNRVVAMKKGRLVDYDINDALKMKRKFNFAAYKATMEVSI